MRRHYTPASLPLLHTGLGKPFELAAFALHYCRASLLLQFKGRNIFVLLTVLGETEAAAKAKKAEDKASAKEAKDKAKEDAAEEKRQSQILEAGDNPMAESDEEGEGDEDEEAPDLNLGGL